MGGVTRSGVGGRKIPRDGGGGGRRAGEDRGTAEWGEMEVTETMAMATSGRRRRTEDPPVSTQNNGAGRKYCVGGNGTEESTDKSAKWSREETEGSATEKEAETAGSQGRLH